MNGPRRIATAGFTLIELLVAVVLLAVVMAGLFPVTFKVALQSRQANVRVQRTMTAAAEVGYLSSLPFASVAAGSSCTTFSAATFPHTKCVTVVDLNPTRKRITVIVTPLNGSGVGADTTVVERSAGKSGNPLNYP